MTTSRTNSKHALLRSIAEKTLNIDGSSTSDRTASVDTLLINERIIRSVYSYLGLVQPEYIHRDSLLDLLSSNNLHFRSCTLLPSNRRSEQDCFLTTFSGADENLCLVFPNGRKRRIYDPRADITTYVNEQDVASVVASCGYELYPVLPPQANSFKQLLFFALNGVKSDLAKAISISLLLTVFGLFSPLITSHVIGDVVPSGDLNWIISTFVVSILLSVYTSLISWVQSYYSIRVNQKLSRRLEIALYKRLLSYPVEFIDQYTAGDLSSRISSASRVISGLSSSIFSSAIQFLSLFAYMAMMVYFDAELALAAITVTIIVTLIDVFLVRRQLSFQKQSVELSAHLYNETLQTLSSIAQVRTNSSEPFILNKWLGSILKISDLSYESSRMSDYNSAVSSMASILGNSVIYAVLVSQLLRATSSQAVIATAGTFIIFTSAFSSFSGSFRSLVSFVNDLFGSLLIDWERGYPMVAQIEEQSSQTDCKRVKVNQDISFSNVSFRYNDALHDVIKNASFTIKAEKFNVIFGPSGCGKSTIISLLLGFYRPKNGLIAIGDVDLKSLDISNYRSQIGVVLQNPSLPPSSIKDSVSRGLNVSDQQIWNALQIANIAEEVNNLPMKLETILSEGASNISGGQRQRLCIARALVNNPRLLIEDEATSALDPTSQSRILANLKGMRVTRLVIAHRLSAIRGCDHMIVLNRDGRVEAEGTFDHCLESSQYLRSIVET